MIEVKDRGVGFGVDDVGVYAGGVYDTAGVGFGVDDKTQLAIEKDHRAAGTRARARATARARVRATAMVQSHSAVQLGLGLGVRCGPPASSPCCAAWEEGAEMGIGICLEHPSPWGIDTDAGTGTGAGTSMGMGRGAQGATLGATVRAAGTVRVAAAVRVRVRVRVTRALVVVKALAISKAVRVRPLSGARRGGRRSVT